MRHSARITIATALTTCIAAQMMFVAVATAQNQPVASRVLSNTVQQTEKTAYGKETQNVTQVSTIVGRIVNSALSLLGTIFVVLLVYAGFKWMTAGGNEEEIEKAKAIIWQATIGIIIVVAALLITNFVLASLARATI